MPGIGVISNRNARLNKLNPNIKDRLAFVLGQGGEVISTGSLDDAQVAIAEFKRIGIDMIAISGGDGTAHRTIELLIEVYGEEKIPPVLLLPTGTQNMIPASFGIRDSGLATLVLAQARYRHNLPLRTIKRNVLKVNDHYSFMFAIGIAPRFLQEYYRRGETTPLGAAKLLGHYVGSAMRKKPVIKELLKPFAVSVQRDQGPTHQVEAHSIFCSFVERLPLAFDAFPRAGWDPKVFESLVIHAAPAQVVKALPQLWLGSTRKMPGFQRSQVSRIEFKLDGVEPYTLDGEVYEAKDHFVLTAGPELDFVVPGFKIGHGDKKIRHGKAGPWGMRYFV